MSQVFPEVEGGWLGDVIGARESVLTLAAMKREAIMGSEFDL
jgi:hypothetical protein